LGPCVAFILGGEPTHHRTVLRLVSALYSIEMQSVIMAHPRHGPTKGIQAKVDVDKARQ